MIISISTKDVKKRVKETDDFLIRYKQIGHTGNFLDFLPG